MSAIKRYLTDASGLTLELIDTVRGDDMVVELRVANRMFLVGEAIEFEPFQPPKGAQHIVVDD